MSKLFNWAAARLVAAFALALPLVATADVPMTNPVTSETETYSNAFIGETEEWNSADNWDTTTTPFIVTTYSPALVTGKVVSTSTAIDGWTLRVGAYNGAAVTWSGGITKIQAGSVGCWLTADETSSITIASFAGNQLEGGDSAPFKLSSAKAGGITWSAGLTSSSNTTLPFWYYLKGAGTVVYGGDITVANAQVIKMADVTLSGNEKSVQSKTLVTFGSGTTKTFTADAAVKIKNGDNVLKTVYLTSVTADATTLTTDDDVGACELVQTSTGIVLYYVDGDPADVPVEEKTYKPSININFTNGAGNGLTTQADVGLSGYEVPGTSWNNYVVANSTFSTVNAVDSTGAASAMSGVSVTISNVSGSWGCSGLTASSDFRQSYIDESAAKSTPTVTVTGIPYYKYRVLVYHSTDTADVPFGYDTINGTDYTYVNDALAEGTTAWGNSGAKDSANAIAEGGNVLVTEALSGSTLTVVGHRAGGANNARGCIAAIQIIEVKADVGENDLEIPVSGDTQYTVEETKELSGTVYLTGLGTLTLAGENKISAATIDVGDLVTLVINADRLDGTTFTGGGTVVYNNALPVTGKGWTDSSAWTGTVWINGKSGVTDFNVNSYGNANSAVKLSGVDGWISAPFDNTVPVILENGEFEYALKLTNGNSPNNQYPKRCTTFVKVSGSGTISDGGSANPMLKIYDGTKFTGALTLTRARVVFCAADSTTLPDAYNTGIPAASIYVDSGNSATVASGKTWTADGGFVVNGTLNANGTLASSLATKAVSGTGTVVFGGVPSPTGDAWWKNAAWTGTVEIKGATALNGDYAFNDYGNSGSTLKLTNCSGWLKPNYTCVPALEIGGTFTWNDGSSGLNNTFKVATLKGSGTISIPNQGAATAVWQITENWSGFTGAVVGNNGAAKRILVFGSTLPTTATAGVIYVSEGATLDLDNASSAWWGVGMGFVVDGTVKASARNKWGGGTYMKLGDTGVLELVTGAEYVHDAGTSFSNVTGTGTVRYTGSNWRSLPDGDNMFATTLSIELENDAGVVFNGGSTDGSTGTIGGLFGTKNLRTDLGGYSKVLTVKQAKDGLWSGIISAGDRLDTFIVDPGETTTGTLTLAGTHTSDNKLTVNGSVNLTGTWKGATTVAGTFGGTGTLTGDLTFSDGATLKANASALTVSGTVTIPAGEGESLTIDATDLDAEEVTILSSESITTETDVSKVTVNGLYTVTPVAGALKLVSTKVAVTIPAIANATVTVSVGGETIGTEAGTYNVAPDAVVTATYAAAEGYEISGQTVYTINVANSETTFDPAGTTEVKQYVAYVVFQQESGQSFIDVTNNYTTVSNAIDAAKAMKKTVVLIAQPEATDTYNISAGETINVKKGEFTFDGIVFPEGPQYNNTTTVTAGVTQYKCAVYTATVQYPGQEPVGMTGSLIQILGGLYSGYVPGYAGTVVTVLDGSDDTVGDAMPEVFTYDSEAHTYTLMTMVASYYNGFTTTYYPTLSNAFDKVVAGGIIKVIADNTLTGSTTEDAIAVTKNLTLDLNGYIVTGAAGDVPMFNVGAVSFTITDTSEGKTGKAVSAGSKVILSGSACTITLNAGTLESGNNPIYLYNSNGDRIVNIHGGKLVCNYTGSEHAYAIVNVNGSVNVTAGEIESQCGGFEIDAVTFSGGSLMIGPGSEKQVFHRGSYSSTITVTGGTFNRDINEYCASGYAAYEYSTGIWTVSEVYVEGQDICLDGTNVTINASQAAWLKACGDKATVSNKIENLTFDQFYNDYLLNLDILASENDYTFAVKGIAVGEDTVDVTVTLTRTGALTENEKAKPIVGTLKLKGTASLGTAFTVLGEASVEFDANAKFGDGATETTVTVDTTETDAKFFQPVIE